MLNKIKYAILRREILDRTIDRLPYHKDKLSILCNEIEGKTEKELREIHKFWIGYAYDDGDKL